EAYTFMAEAAAQHAHGTPMAETLAGADLPKSAIRAAQRALDPSPRRRASLGGPAPKQVAAALATLEAQLDEARTTLDGLHEQAGAPLALLAEPPITLLQKAGGG
ncbi:MAG: hypothetical protein R3185_05895, partial [Candidatus Thermoplasmatota archaeon]|nr:hypothetical protein [Candidatus Thermoplasmatota archaeon]